MRSSLVVATTLAALCGGAMAQTVTSPSFINGIALNGSLPDLSGGSPFDSRVGFFSDL